MSHTISPTTTSFASTLSTATTALNELESLELKKTKIIFTVVASLNSLSALACFLVLLVYVCLRRSKQRQAVDRVSIRLAAAACLVDFSYCLVQIFSNLPLQGVVCEASTWAYICLTLLSTFFFTCIAINLQLIFLTNVKPRACLEIWYFAGALLLALLIPAVGWILRLYGSDPLISGGCWFKGDGKASSLLWQWILLYGWLAACIIYCYVIVFLVFRRISAQLRDIDRSFNGANRALEERKLSSLTTLYKRQHISRLRIIRRILIYPSIPLFTQLLTIAVAMDLYVNRRNHFILILLSFVTTSMQGLLNSLAFMFDPSITSALKAWRMGSDEVEAVFVPPSPSSSTCSSPGPSSGPGITTTTTSSSAATTNITMDTTSMPNYTVVELSNVPKKKKKTTLPLEPSSTSFNRMTNDLESSFFEPLEEKEEKKSSINLSYY